MKAIIKFAVGCVKFCWAVTIGVVIGFAIANILADKEDEVETGPVRLDEDQEVRDES